MKEPKKFEWQKVKNVLRSGILVAMSALALAAVIKPVSADNPNATVTGTVFDDRNENGVQDKGEKGLANVTVSDGKNITVTDKQGKYELVVETDRRVSDIVFVTTPSGYTVPTDDNKTPQFYKQLGQAAPHGG